MDIRTISNAVLSRANSKDVIFYPEIVEIIKSLYPGFNEDYKNIVIKQLRDSGIIYSYDTGKYKAYKNRKPFVFARNEEIEKQLSFYRGDKDFSISYFDSSFFNKLCSLQSTKSYLFIGVEYYVVNYLSDRMEKDKKNVIVTNDLAKLRKFYSGIDFDFDYVIKTINIDTPLVDGEDSVFRYPKIETLLVDLLSDKTLKDLYSFEIETIYRNAFKRYAIKINTLLRYAEKKGVVDHIRYILLTIGFDIEKGEFND